MAFNRPGEVVQHQLLLTPYLHTVGLLGAHGLVKCAMEKIVSFKTIFLGRGQARSPYPFYPGDVQKIRRSKISSTYISSFLSHTITL